MTDNIWRIMYHCYLLLSLASSVDYYFGEEKLCFTNRLQYELRFKLLKSKMLRLRVLIIESKPLD